MPQGVEVVTSASSYLDQVAQAQDVAQVLGAVLALSLMAMAVLFWSYRKATDATHSRAVQLIVDRNNAALAEVSEAMREQGSQNRKFFEAMIDVIRESRGAERERSQDGR